MSKAAFPLVAGVITGQISEGILKKAVRDGASLLELRIDTFEDTDPEKLIKDIDKAKRASKLPILVTIRSKKEGGLSDMPEAQRKDLYIKLMPFADFVDVELNSGKINKDVLKSARRHGKKAIISFHDFKTTPGDARLRSIVKKGRGLGADIVKIAAKINRAEDLKRLARLLLDSKNTVIIGMGEAGAASRVFFPLLGSMITYGSISRSTAPGQLPLKTIKDALVSFQAKG